MFFIKVGENNIQIGEENTFCFCPECGQKVYMSLSKFLKEEYSNLSDEIFCKDCSKKYL